MARPLVRLVGSLSILVLGSVALGSIAGCGGSPRVAEDGGTDAAEPQPDAPRDFCDPYVLEPVADDPCELALPEGFVPARIFFFQADGSDVALDRHPDPTYCETAGGFTVDDETAPTVATLCPSTCSELPDETPEILGTACGI